MSTGVSTTPLVIHVLPVLDPSGAERIVAELAQRLPPHGFETRVLCLEDERAAIGIELAEAGIPVHGLRLSRRRTLAAAGAIARQIAEGFSAGVESSAAGSRDGRQRPLILHAHLFHANIATRLAWARLPRELQRRTRVLSTVQVVERRFRPWHFWLDRWTARYCDLEVCVSEDVRRFQQARTRLPGEFFRVIENAIDTDRFIPRKRDAAGQTTSNTASHILAVGRLDRQKDYATLLRAWQLVNAQKPDAKLTIAGDGPERLRLQALADSLGLRNLEFAGFISDIPALLRSADLFVQSSLWEGLPLSVIEAMAAGLPIVATEAEGTRNVIERGRNGLLVPRSNPRALAEGLLQLMNNPAESARLAAAARAAAVERFSIDSMVCRYAALYREVLAKERT